MLNPADEAALRYLPWHWEGAYSFAVVDDTWTGSLEQVSGDLAPAYDVSALTGRKAFGPIQPGGPHRDARLGCFGPEDLSHPLGVRGSRAGTRLNEGLVGSTSAVQRAQRQKTVCQDWRLIFRLRAHHGSLFAPPRAA